GFGIGGGAVLEDEPLAFGDDGEGEAFLILFHGEAGGFVAVTGAGGELLLTHWDGVHVFVEEGDGELALFDGDLAVHGFVFAEFEDAAAVGADLNAAVSKKKAGGGGEDEGGDEAGFHGNGARQFFLRVVVCPQQQHLYNGLQARRLYLNLIS